ncbi:MAG: leucine-rich repeat protein, partial [Clostridia bacterium]|nr:leucine-rich repeat protein [Clostridia bacterium]
MAKTKVKTKKTSPIVKIIVGVLSAVVGLSVCWGIVLFLTRDSHRHTYTVGFDRDYHYKVCSECGIEKDKKAHSSSESCSSCDFHITEGFIFSDRPGGVEITSWDGVTDTVVFLPETHNGRPVISIASGALAGLTEITHLDIPTSVVKIGSLAIKNCYKLESLVTPFIGSSPIIGANTSENRLDYYLDNVDLKKLTVLGGKLGEYALQGASFLEKVDLKIEINSFPRHVFDGCTKLNTLTYLGNPKRIEEGAFLN